MVDSGVWFRCRGGGIGGVWEDLAPVGIWDGAWRNRGWMCVTDVSDHNL